VDVGPLVIPHAQAAKLTEPGKCALHDPVMSKNSVEVSGVPGPVRPAGFGPYRRAVVGRLLNAFGL